MYARFFKAALFVMSGIIVGALFAKFKTSDYHHAMLVLKKGAEARPLYVSRNDGRQVLALSLKNLQSSRDIEIRMAGADVQSWYPPVIKMPFRKWMEVEGGKFRGVDSGTRLPLYVISDSAVRCGDIEIIDSSNGSLIQTVHVMRGDFNGGHH